MLGRVGQGTVVVLAVDLDDALRRPCAGSARETGWSLMKARVRPSAYCTRRRMRSPSVSISCACANRRAAWSSGRSKTALTWPCASPWRTSEPSPRAAERERKAVEQDRLARAGLAGEHGEPFAEAQIEPIDQDDVADGELGQHGSARFRKPAGAIGARHESRPLAFEAAEPEECR